MKNFADRFVERERAIGHPLCAGLDPHLALIPELFRRGAMDPRDPATCEAVEAMLGTFLDRVGGRVAIVKPQIAFFERLGWRGLAALGRLMERARQLGLLVLLDAKRGDIGSTAQAYAESHFADDAELAADALTVSPYLGLDALEPFVALAARHGRAPFVLVRTSNAGAHDFQDVLMEEDLNAQRDGRRGARPLFHQVAAALVPAAQRLQGTLGFSSLGVVVGATHPDDAPRVRELLPTALFLVPGYGAQGGSADAAVAGFVRSAAGRLEGGVVNSSRALLFPEAAKAATSAAAWEAAVDEAVDRAAGELAAAVG